MQVLVVRSMQFSWIAFEFVVQRQNSNGILKNFLQVNQDFKFMQFSAFIYFFTL